VGYRVNSKRGTQFGIWATRVLRAHIIQGYTVNQNRLHELNQAVKLITDTASRRDISGDEAKALLAVVGDYNRALELLDDYDHQQVSKPKAVGSLIRPLDYAEALRIVDQLRGEFAESDVFGVEKDKSLASALGAIMQTADGLEVYPSLEKKAANLLYFLVKNQAFVDGNKRIAAALFLWFLSQNERLDKSKLPEETLVAMTLGMLPDGFVPAKGCKSGTIGCRPHEQCYPRGR
jgi:prophage maintenance system killer protein